MRPAWDNTNLRAYTTGQGGGDVVSLGDGEFYLPRAVEIIANKRGSSSAMAIIVPCDDRWVSDVSNAYVAQVNTDGKSNVGFLSVENYSGWDQSSGCTVALKFTLSEITNAIIALFFDGVYTGRYWLSANEPDVSIHNPSLPLWARGDGDSNFLISINGQSTDRWAGWLSELPAGGVVRMTGFNLPRSLTSYTGATPTTINAEGGDYGIEFTIPQNSDSVAIFDETFWLYIR